MRELASKVTGEVVLTPQATQGRGSDHAGCVEKDQPGDLQEILQEEHHEDTEVIDCDDVLQIGGDDQGGTCEDV